MTAYTTANPFEPKAEGMDLTAFTSIFTEIENQPAWRSKADREMEYVDGNQLSSELLQKQREIGMPPAIENLVGPAIKNVTGYEAKTRTDWRVTPDGDKSGDDVAAALNYKLNQAERKSGADKACGDAFRTQAAVGIGWVEVSRNDDPFKPPYRCRAVHRNEIYWDMLSTEPDLSDARYLVRRRWLDAAMVKLAYPDHAELVMQSACGWTAMDPMFLDGTGSTDLAMAMDHERGWSIEEQQWRNIDQKRVCLFEVWYRTPEWVTVLKSPDGRVVEFDKKNPMHSIAIAIGKAFPQKTRISRMRKAVWLGPHKLEDGPSPFPHRDFPYVPFWGDKEDRTGVPYGIVRNMIYQQDNVNATQGKIRWGLSARRTVRTKGAVAMSDAQFRRMVARPDADIILNAEEMSKTGAQFKVEQDEGATQQQYQMLVDSRAAIERTSGITSAFAGREGTATSGVQESTQVEQSVQSVAELMDNFKYGRAKVGELLLSLIVEDMIGKQETVTIDGGSLKDDRVINLNVPTTDEFGVEYLTNDVSRTLTKVALSDVPSTPSFRAQQLAAMSEAFKSMPQKFQEAVLPHLLNLMDIPDRDEVVRVIREAAQNLSPDEVEARVKEAVTQALKQAGVDLKERELGLKYMPELMQAQIADLVSKAFKTNVEALFAASQTAAQLAVNPGLAPAGDAISTAAGFRTPNPGGDDPNLPVVQAQLPPPGSVQPTGVPQNTSPGLPPVPASPASPMTGIETERTTDNLPA